MATFVPYLIALYCLSLVHAQSQMFIDRHHWFAVEDDFLLPRNTAECPVDGNNNLSINTTLSLLEVVGVNVADPQGKGTLSLNQPILA